MLLRLIMCFYKVWHMSIVVLNFYIYNKNKIIFVIPFIIAGQTLAFANKPENFLLFLYREKIEGLLTEIKGTIINRDL